MISNVVNNAVKNEIKNEVKTRKPRRTANQIMANKQAALNKMKNKAALKLITNKAKANAKTAKNKNKANKNEVKSVLSNIIKTVVKKNPMPRKTRTKKSNGSNGSQNS